MALNWATCTRRTANQWGLEQLCTAQPTASCPKQLADRPLPPSSTVTGPSDVMRASSRCVTVIRHSMRT